MWEDYKFFFEADLRDEVERRMKEPKTLPPPLSSFPGYSADEVELHVKKDRERRLLDLASSVSFLKSTSVIQGRINHRLQGHMQISETVEGLDTFFTYVRESYPR